MLVALFDHAPGKTSNLHAVPTCLSGQVVRERDSNEIIIATIALLHSFNPLQQRLVCLREYFLHTTDELTSVG